MAQSNWFRPQPNALAFRPSGPEMSLIFNFWNETNAKLNISSLRFNFSASGPCSFQGGVSPECWGHTNRHWDHWCVSSQSVCRILDILWGNLDQHKAFRPFKVDRSQCGSRGFGQTLMISMLILQTGAVTFCPPSRKQNQTNHDWRSRIVLAERHAYLMVQS